MVRGSRVIGSARIRSVGGGGDVLEVGVLPRTPNSSRFRCWRRSAMDDGDGSVSVGGDGSGSGSKEVVTSSLGRVVVDSTVDEDESVVPCVNDRVLVGGTMIGGWWTRNAVETAIFRSTKHTPPII